MRDFLVRLVLTATLLMSPSASANLANADAGLSPNQPPVVSAYTPDNFLIGLPQGDLTTLPFAQQRILAYGLKVAADAYLVQHQRDPKTTQELLGLVPWWPLDESHTPWLRRQNGMFNVREIQAGDGFMIMPDYEPLEAEIVVIPAAKWTGKYAKRVVEKPLAGRLEPGNDAASRAQEFAGQHPDQAHMAPAIALMKPFVFWLQMHSSLPEAPRAVIQSFGLSINSELVAEMTAHYESAEFFRGQHDEHVGLLLSDGADARWFVYAKRGSPRVELLGWIPLQATEIDRLLLQSKSWGTLGALPRQLPSFDPAEL